MFVTNPFIGINTALTQVIVTYYDVKRPDPNVKGLKRITRYGWIAYVCTIILLMPKYQKYYIAASGQ